MTDTETRLRDYLHTQAATVPDTAQGPGLDEPRRRNHWPVLATAAAIAFVLVLTVTVLTRMSPDSAIPVPAGPPPGPVSRAAPELPYTVATRARSSAMIFTLHDGDRRVRLSGGVTGFSGRVDSGWLGWTMGPRSSSQAGVLKPDGTFRTLGPERSELPVPSPDRRQIAVIHRVDDAKGSIVVVDVKSGKEVSRSPELPIAPAQLGWNESGIWYRVDEPAGPNKPTQYSLHVWRPKSDRVAHVTFPEYNGGLAVPGASDVVGLTTRRGNNRCLKAGVLRDGGFDEVREYCDVAAAATYPVLSPDGRTMVSSDVKLAIDIRSGKQTRLRLPANQEVITWPQPVFENVSQLLLVTQPLGNNRKPVPEQVHRCDVRSGECVAILMGSQITLHER
ncbi:hypothetical protein [Kribbella sp. HUAS MG21]|uniref:WD40 repeat protein n=1 Tax=Kribbella sp. HUAS MG21 TaxID=3160966 RepID=A0AAU7TDA6_9ACTN